MLSQSGQFNISLLQKESSCSPSILGTEIVFCLVLDTQHRCYLAGPQTERLECSDLNSPQAHASI